MAPMLIAPAIVKHSAANCHGLARYLDITGAVAAKPRPYMDSAMATERSRLDNNGMELTGKKFLTRFIKPPLLLYARQRCTSDIR